MCLVFAGTACGKCKEDEGVSLGHIWRQCPSSCGNLGKSAWKFGTKNFHQSCGTYGGDYMVSQVVSLQRAGGAVGQRSGHVPRPEKERRLVVGDSNEYPLRESNRWTNEHMNPTSPNGIGMEIRKINIPRLKPEVVFTLCECT